MKMFFAIFFITVILPAGTKANDTTFPEVLENWFQDKIIEKQLTENDRAQVALAKSQFEAKNSDVDWGAWQCKFYLTNPGTLNYQGYQFKEHIQADLRKREVPYVNYVEMNERNLSEDPEFIGRHIEKCKTGVDSEECVNEKIDIQLFNERMAGKVKVVFKAYHGLDPKYIKEGAKYLKELAQESNGAIRVLRLGEENRSHKFKVTGFRNLNSYFMTYGEAPRPRDPLPHYYYNYTYQVVNIACKSSKTVESEIKKEQVIIRKDVNDGDNEFIDQQVKIEKKLSSSVDLLVESIAAEAQLALSTSLNSDDWVKAAEKNLTRLEVDQAERIEIIRTIRAERQRTVTLYYGDRARERKLFFQEFKLKIRNLFLARQKRNKMSEDGKGVVIDEPTVKGSKANSKQHAKSETEDTNSNSGDIQESTNVSKPSPDEELNRSASKEVAPGRPGEASADGGEGTVARSTALSSLKYQKIEKSGKKNKKAMSGSNQANESRSSIEKNRRERKEKQARDKKDKKERKKKNKRNKKSKDKTEESVDEPANEKPVVPEPVKPVQPPVVQPVPSQKVSEPKPVPPPVQNVRHEPAGNGGGAGNLGVLPAIQESAVQHFSDIELGGAYKKQKRTRIKKPKKPKKVRSSGRSNDDDEEEDDSVDEQAPARIKKSKKERNRKDRKGAKHRAGTEGEASTEPENSDQVIEQTETITEVTTTKWSKKRGKKGKSSSSREQISVSEKTISEPLNTEQQDDEDSKTDLPAVDPSSIAEEDLKAKPIKGGGIALPKRKSESAKATIVAHVEVPPTETKIVTVKKNKNADLPNENVSLNKESKIEVPVVDSNIKLQEDVKSPAVEKKTVQNKIDPAKLKLIKQYEKNLNGKLFIVSEPTKEQLKKYKKPKRAKVKRIWVPKEKRATYPGGFIPNPRWGK